MATILSAFLRRRCLGDRFSAGQGFGQNRWFSGSGRHSTDQTLGAGADQILPVGSHKGFPHQVIVLGIAVLDQRPLHGLLMGIRGHIDRPHGAGIQTGVIHGGGQGAGGGIEILHLLGRVSVLFEAERKLEEKLKKSEEEKAKADAAKIQKEGEAIREST